MQRLEPRELAGQAVDQELVELLRLAQVLEPVGAEIPEEKRVVEQLGRRSAHEHLPPVAGRHDPRRAVHVDADVRRRRRQRLTRMNAHPHPQVEPFRPRLAGERPLRLRRRGGRALGPRIRDEERVARAIDLVPVVVRERSSQQPTVRVERLRIPLSTELVQEASRPLDVGEYQRHRAGGLDCHERTIAPRGHGGARDSNGADAVGRPFWTAAPRRSQVAVYRTMRRAVLLGQPRRTSSTAMCRSTSGW